MSSKHNGSDGGAAALLVSPEVRAPAVGVIVLRGSVDIADAPRLNAELDGRLAVGTQVMVIDVGEVRLIDSAALGVLAAAAQRLQDDRSGSMVLRGASSRLLAQLRLMRLDHIFELEL